MLAERQVNFSLLNNSFSCVDAEELPQYYEFYKLDGNTSPCGPKAAIERLLAIGAGFFPEKMVIPRKIISIDQTEEVANCLITGINQRYSMGIRTISDRPLFGGAKLPWELDINSPVKVDSFIRDTLPQWKAIASQNNYQITQLILMHNPPGIGVKVDHPNQFVYRMVWDNYNSLNNLGSRLLVEMVTGTNKLRLLDQCMDCPNRKVFRYEYFYKPNGFLEKTEYQGEETSLASDPHGDNLFYFVVGNINDLIRDPSCQLTKRVQFFASIGLNIFEFQGVEDQESKLPQSYLYGLRGCADETNTGLHP